MGNFNKGGKFGGEKGGKKFGGKKEFGGRSFGGDRGGSRGGNRGGFGSGRDRERPVMHSATCAECGKGCEVPFRPTGDKPVYCSECFKNKGEGNSRSSNRGGRDFGERNPRSSFDSKPTYQKDGGKSSENTRAQFEVLNNKLDRILKILAPIVSENEKQGTKLEKNEEFITKTKKVEKDKVAPNFIKPERTSKAKKAVKPASLKKALDKAMDKKTSAKKVVKKIVAKKSSVKKVVPKKKVVKKATTKKTVAKKTTKKVAPKKSSAKKKK